MSSSGRRGAPENRTERAEAVKRPAPGISTLLDGVARGRKNLSILDLALGTDAALRVYSKHARWVRFAGIVNEHICSARDLLNLPDTPEPPYNLVFAWDLFDRVLPHERPSLAPHLAKVCAPNAGLHMLVSVSAGESYRSVRYSLWDEHHIRREFLGSPGLGRQFLQPAEVERLLAPFRVERGVALQGGMREYVAIGPGRARYGDPGW